MSTVQGTEHQNQPQAQTKYNLTVKSVLVVSYSTVSMKLKTQALKHRGTLQ